MIIVTGGAGFIGSNLVHELNSYSPEPQSPEEQTLTP
jgi:dTDP-D-glucose 4,6-dehydratase